MAQVTKLSNEAGRGSQESFGLNSFEINFVIISKEIYFFEGIVCILVIRGIKNNKPRKGQIG